MYQVAFANSPLSGLFIIAGMFVGNPNVGWACLLAGLVGVIFSKVSQSSKVNKRSQGQITNGSRCIYV